jgi:hypothetical protein
MWECEWLISTHCRHWETAAFLTPMLRAAAPILCIVALSSCSYSYDVHAKVSGGRLVFDANPQWGADCVRRVEVTSEERAVGTVWEQSISYDDACANKFPIVYGARLPGHPQIYDNGGVPEAMIGTPAPSVTAKKLTVGVIYTVSTTTGATGYGCGRFRIGSDRQVENLGCP